MKTLNEVLENGNGGLHYGSRVLLPFAAEILKIVIGHEIITDFSKKQHGASVRIAADYTEIYFCDYKNLEEELASYEVIKVVIVEQGKDIFDFKNHVSLELDPEEKHRLKIAKIGDDLIFFE
ncbi:MAG: hypothetical protein ABFS12_10095 [Bacteroidota bacterium]